MQRHVETTEGGVTPVSGTVPPDPTAPDISGVPDDSDPDLLRALERVDADLAALRDAPAPPIPDDVAARLDATLRKARPTRSRAQHVGSWIIAAAAAVALFGGVTVFAALRDDAAEPVAVAVPDLGAVPDLDAAFDPAAGTTPDLLARALRGSSVDAGPLADPAALSECLRAATRPEPSWAPCG